MEATAYNTSAVRGWAVVRWSHEGVPWGLLAEDVQREADWDILDRWPPRDLFLWSGPSRGLRMFTLLRGLSRSRSQDRSLCCPLGLAEIIGGSEPAPALQNEAAMARSGADARHQ